MSRLIGAALMFGVALLAMVGDGAYRNVEAACKATIRVAEETPPDRAAVKAYNRLFPIYRDLYGNLGSFGGSQESRKSRQAYRGRFT